MPVRSIVVGWDFDETTAPALAWAERQARLTGETVVLVHVVVPVVPLPEMPIVPSISGNEIRAFEESMRETAARLSVPHDTDLVIGPAVAPALIEAATRHNAALLCVGYGRRGIARMLLGSVATQVVRQSHLPVVVVRE